MLWMLEEGSLLTLNWVPSWELFLVRYSTFSRGFSFTCFYYHFVYVFLKKKSRSISTVKKTGFQEKIQYIIKKKLPLKSFSI